MASDKEKSSPLATILVVDDNKDAVDVLTRLLLRHGMAVLQAYNGSECLETVRTRTVDVILLDVMMPGMGGLAVCEGLKQISPALPAQIILVTAKDDMTTRAAAMTLGVSEFVVKPVNHADLLARIQTQLSARVQQVHDLLAAEADLTPTSQAVRMNNDFATDLYRQLATEHEGDNLFFSPYSIASALVMTAEGARGETARQMGGVALPGDGAACRGRCPRDPVAHRRNPHGHGRP